jgi:hypothetical protein
MEERLWRLHWLLIDPPMFESSAASVSFPQSVYANETFHSFINRENRVPYYQRLFQEGQKKHVRQWEQVRSSNSLSSRHILGRQELSDNS